MKKFQNKILLLLFVFLTNTIFSQIAINSSLSDLDYNNPKEYEIGGITISGVKFLDHNVLVDLSGLKVGEKITIPGEKISNAILKLWKQKLFSDIKITKTKIINNKIIIEPDNESRKDWNEIFTKMAENKDDKLLIDDSIDLDNGDWEW